MGKKLRRKPCDGTKCNDPAFFSAPAKSPGADPFFKSSAGGDAPVIQKEDAPGAPKKEEKKDPMGEGLKLTLEQLFKHKPFTSWLSLQTEPMLGKLKLDLWDNLSTGEKVLLLSHLGLNAAMLVTAFSASPEFRQTLSGVNIGAGLGLIPYSPVSGGSYTLPKDGKTDLGLSADFTLNPYLDLWKNKPWYAPDSATFGLKSTYDMSGQNGFNVTGGNLKLGFGGGALGLSGSFFDSKTISPYPLLMPGTDGGPPSWIMKEIPGMPDQKTGPGWEVGASLDLWKIPKFRRLFGEK